MFDSLRLNDVFSQNDMDEPYEVVFVVGCVLTIVVHFQILCVKLLRLCIKTSAPRTVQHTVSDPLPI